MREIKYHVFKNYADEVGSADEREMYRILQQRPELRKLRYEMTTFCDRVVEGTLYFGCTSFAGDFLLALELETGRITSCGYHRIREENEHKIHRGLWYDENDHCLVFATSTLSPLSKLSKAPGGRVMRYHPDSGEFEEVGKNEPGQYSQATVYDASRRLLYMFNYRAMKFGVFDLSTGRMRHNPFLDSIPHISALDDRGRCWATWEYDHYWCCFDPEKDDFIWFEKAMETAREAANVMYQGAGPVDAMINGGDGFLYVGTALGELYRLDPETADSEYLGRPTPYRRLPGLAVGPDGAIYGAGGDRGFAYLMRYDRDAGRFQNLGRIEAPDGTVCYRPHDLFIHDGRAFVAETDVPYRSGFIWEITL